jgi:hypothetical protein
VAPGVIEAARIAVFEDLYGNLWGLVQFADKPAA